MRFDSRTRGGECQCPLLGIMLRRMGAFGISVAAKLAEIRSVDQQSILPPMATHVCISAVVAIIVTDGLGYVGMYILYGQGEVRVMGLCPFVPSRDLFLRLRPGFFCSVNMLLRSHDFFFCLPVRLGVFVSRSWQLIGISIYEHRARF